MSPKRVGSAFQVRRDDFKPRLSCDTQSVIPQATDLEPENRHPTVDEMMATSGVVLARGDSHDELSRTLSRTSTLQVSSGAGWC